MDLLPSSAKSQRIQIMGANFHSNNFQGPNYTLQGTLLLRRWLLHTWFELLNFWVVMGANPIWLLKSSGLYFQNCPLLRSKDLLKLSYFKKNLDFIYVTSKVNDQHSTLPFESWNYTLKLQNTTRYRKILSSKWALTS